MERLDSHSGGLEGALQQAPRVLQPVGLDLSVYVSLRVVDDALGVGVGQSLVGHQGIGVDRRAASTRLRTSGWT